MKKFVVKVIAVSGINNKIHKYGSIVTEQNFPVGNIDTLVAKGYLELTKDSKKSKHSELLKTVDGLEKELADKQRAYLFIEKEFGKLDKPECSLEDYQNFVDAAQEARNEAVEVENTAADKVQECQNILTKCKSVAARKSADRLLDTANLTFSAAKKSTKKLSKTFESTIQNLKDAHNNLKVYSELERELGSAETAVNVLIMKISKLKK